MIDHDQMIQILKSKVKEVGSQKILAHQMGVSQQYLSDVLKRKRMPNHKILEALGLRPVQYYVRIYPASKSDAEKE
ncbi:MAG: helix-turn-helix domain-containing protein [Chloroflexi bacterium]|nr:helix-turn-helix domain-containing protein [Chloroflexota bacterium]